MGGGLVGGRRGGKYRAHALWKYRCVQPSSQPRVTCCERKDMKERIRRKAPYSWIYGTEADLFEVRITVHTSKLRCARGFRRGVDYFHGSPYDSRGYDSWFL